MVALMLVLVELDAMYGYADADKFMSHHHIFILLMILRFLMVKRAKNSKDLWRKQDGRAKINFKS